jgi:Flp pilus assembly protein TadG
MRLRKQTERRSGSAVVEAAIVLPVALFLIYVIFSGALMVLVTDEVATASREGARFASVHGQQYQSTTKRPAATADDIKAYVLNQGVTLDPSLMTVNVSWNASNRMWNYVTVEVRYQWEGSGPFAGREFVSRSTMLVSY